MIGASVFTPFRQRSRVGSIGVHPPQFPTAASLVICEADVAAIGRPRNPTMPITLDRFRQLGDGPGNQFEELRTEISLAPSYERVVPG